MLNLADLEARVARLESRNYVSMRYGRVTGTKDGEAQIQLNDAKNNVSICRMQKCAVYVYDASRFEDDGGIKEKLIALG